MTVGRRAATSDRVRTSLVDAAGALLAERRSTAITSRHIARHAGVSDGVLYNHFGDKHDLLLTALVRRFRVLMDEFQADRVEPGSGPVSHGVAAVVRRSYELHLAALPMLANLVGDPALLERFLVEIHRPPLGGDAFRRPVVDFLVAEQALGRLGVFDPEAAADVIVGAVLLQGLIDTLSHRPPGDAATRLAGIAATLLSGLMPAHSGPKVPTPHPTRSTP